jgi:hypothetical protein
VRVRWLFLFICLFFGDIWAFFLYREWKTRSEKKKHKNKTEIILYLVFGNETLLKNEKSVICLGETMNTGLFMGTPWLRMNSAVIV